MISESNDNNFRGEIKVASRIIDYLSSGLYPSPAACLKELINNAYDADASIVHVYVKPDADRVIVEDDGCGMNRVEFQKHFDRVSESHKRDSSDTTASGRPKIGKIGIGFIAANELCEVMEVYSTKEGSKELLHITIDFEEMRKPIQDRRTSDGDIVKADYTGELLEAPIDEHYTRIFLTRVRERARDILAGAKSDSLAPDSKAETLYGLTSESIGSKLHDLKKLGWRDFDNYSDTMLEVSLNVPVKYHENWMPNHLRKYVKKFERETEKLNFTVVYDGTELRKPIVFEPQDKKSIIEPFSFNGTHVSAKGYFYAQHGVIKPDNLKGLLLRIRHAAVGEYDDTFLDFTQSEYQLIQRWISAEIWADDRLEDAMNIDRRTLRATHPAYVELREAIHIHFRKVLKRALDELYKSGSSERKNQKAHDEMERFSSIANSLPSSTSKILRSTLVEPQKGEDIDAQLKKFLLSKYSVSQLFGIISDVAQETLPPSYLDKFMKRLIERLRR